MPIAINSRDTEIFVNYGYDMDYAPAWYKELKKN